MSIPTTFRFGDFGNRREEFKQVLGTENRRKVPHSFRNQAFTLVRFAPALDKLAAAVFPAFLRCFDSSIKQPFRGESGVRKLPRNPRPLNRSPALFDLVNYYPGTSVPPIDAAFRFVLICNYTGKEVV